jgi:hypothetical protein
MNNWKKEVNFLKKNIYYIKEKNFLKINNRKQKNSIFVNDWDNKP